jgi:hypothetical protein
MAEGTAAAATQIDRSRYLRAPQTLLLVVADVPSSFCSTIQSLDIRTSFLTISPTMLETRLHGRRGPGSIGSLFHDRNSRELSSTNPTISSSPIPNDAASPSATASNSASAISNCASIRARLGTGELRARIS